MQNIKQYTLESDKINEFKVLEFKLKWPDITDSPPTKCTNTETLKTIHKPIREDPKGKCI